MRPVTALGRLDISGSTSQIVAVLGDVLMGARYLGQLPFLLRHPVTVAAARVAVARRLAQRDAEFLAHVRAAVYGRAGSPYRALLRLAGCEAGDFERLVRQEGVEGALRALFAHGVYLTVDELRGRRPVRRGSATVALEPDQLVSPLGTGHLVVRSGGSRSRGTPIPIDLAYVRDRAVNGCLTVDARGGDGWAHAVWGVPRSTLLINLLEYSAFGRVTRWFSQIDPASPELHPRYRWSARLTLAGSRLARRDLPRPEHVPVDDPRPIARWMRAELGAGRTPHLHAYTSAIVRLCQAARSEGIDLVGAQFTCVGEPSTAARLVAIRALGVSAWPRYAALECGPVGFGCLEPAVPDDLHLFHDRLAAIQSPPGSTPAGLPADALLFTSLRPTSAPLTLLNVSLGDRAIVTERRCGCPLGALGWAGHLHDVRSFEKLTAGGMTFFDSDVIRVLEEVLPARFGGGPSDYQLVEAEARDGRPRLTLVVRPDVGPVDPDAVTRAFLDALGSGAGAERVMSLAWRGADLLRVERRAPATTATGKILHLHLERSHPPGTSAPRDTGEPPPA